LTKVVSEKRISFESELDRPIPKIFSNRLIGDLNPIISRDLPITSREISPTEYIGKPDVPFTPSMVGWAILNQFKPNISKDERRLKNSSLPKKRRIKH